jgi:hypothetical protein
MKSFSKYLLVVLGSVLLFASCSQKKESPASKEGYVGHWELKDPQGNIYYMTLNPDGSGNTTREGGEFGKWQFKTDHVEAEWLSKNFKLHFNSGESQPLPKDPAANAGE